MKKQRLEKKLFLRTTKISHLSTPEKIIGGRTITCNPCIISDVKTCQTVPVPITDAICCTHTIGNGLDIDGNPCTY